MSAAFYVSMDLRGKEVCKNRLAAKSLKLFAIFLKTRIKESGLCVKFNLHTPYCGWYIGAEFLNEIVAKADKTY